MEGNIPVPQSIDLGTGNARVSFAKSHCADYDANRVAMASGRAHRAVDAVEEETNFLT
jgi:hypothetical protein